MESPVKLRLIQFIEYKGLSKNKFETICGLSSRYVSNIKVSILPPTIEKIATKFPELNTAWLMTGMGTMLNDPVLVQDNSLMTLVMSQQKIIEDQAATIRIQTRMLEQADREKRSSDVRENGPAGCADAVGQ